MYSSQKPHLSLWFSVYQTKLVTVPLLLTKSSRVHKAGNTGQPAAFHADQCSHSCNSFFLWFLVHHTLLPSPWPLLSLLSRPRRIHSLFKCQSSSGLLWSLSKLNWDNLMYTHGSQCHLFTDVYIFNPTLLSPDTYSQLSTWHLIGIVNQHVQIEHIISRITPSFSSHPVPPPAFPY